MTKNRLLQLSREWMQRGDYDRIIRELGSIPTSRRGAKLTAMLARARMTRYEGADDAPAGWKEETIRDLEVFMDSASPEWREVLVQLKGKLDPSARPAPEPPRPKEAPEEKKESHGDPAPSSSSGADTGKIGRRVTSLMQNRKYGEALKAFESTRKGLSSEEAEKRRETFGRNTLKEQKKKQK